MAQRSPVAVLPVILTLLSGCGGGGGGGSVARPDHSLNEVPFASFTAIAPGQTVVLQGDAVTVTGTSNGTLVVPTEVSAVGPASLRLTHDANTAVTSIRLDTARGSATFDRNVDCSSASCGADNATQSVVTVNPAGWNYQTFGVWGSTEFPTGAWELGAFSAGSPTRGNALPTAGIANFSGMATGFYVDSAGNPYATFATMSANVNFSSRNIAFATSNTQMLSANAGAELADASGFNLSGSLSYAPGVNAFSGRVQTGNALLGGNAAGRFYGPAAEEMGGVYSLQGTGVSRMVGGFGARR